jgi:hypothetical protein
MSSFLKQYDNWFAPFEAFQEPLAEPQELAIA